MSGNSKGGKKAAATLKSCNPDFYKEIGRMGGRKSRGGGFTNNPELARKAGEKGRLNRYRSTQDEK